MDFINADGAQHCKVCNATFKVFDLEERSVDFCPFCNSRADNLEPIDEEEEDE